MSPTVMLDYTSMYGVENPAEFGTLKDLMEVAEEIKMNSPRAEEGETREAKEAKEIKELEAKLNDL